MFGRTAAVATEFLTQVLCLEPASAAVLALPSWRDGISTVHSLHGMRASMDAPLLA